MVTVTIRGRQYRPFKYWRKGTVLFVGFFIAGSGARELLAFYIGFWFARWTYNLRIIRAQKKVGDATKVEGSA